MAGNNWSVAADGGHLANPKLSKKLRYANTAKYIFRQFTRKEPGYGKNVGDSIDFDKVTMAQTEGRAITEFEDIPETKVLIRRGSLSVTEYANSIPWSGKLELLSEFDPEMPIQKAIMNDEAKVIDHAVVAELKTADITYVPSTVTTQTWRVDGTFVATAAANFNLFHLKELVDAAKTGIFGSGNTGAPIPTFPDGNYVLVLSVKAARGLLDDPEYQEAAKFAFPRQLLNGELDEVIYNTRIIVSNDNSSLSNAKGTGSVLGEGIFMGDDAIIEGVALEEELRYKLAVKYGRDKGLAWYAILGFEVPWDFTTDGECHVIRIGSA